MRPTRRDLREQWQLALPLALSQLAQHLMGLVNTAMLGHYDRVSLAGAGIGNSLIFTVTVLGLGAVMGLDTLIPQAIGAGEETRARRLLWQGVRLAVLAGVPLTAVTAAMPLLLGPAGVDAAVAHQLTIYVLWRLPAVIPFLVVAALRSYLQAIGITRPIVLAMVAGNLVNVGADAVLIFGWGPIPAMGVTGAAIATSTVSLAIMVVLALAIRATTAPDGPTGAGVPAADRAMMRSILRLGLPVGLQLVAEVGVFGLASVLAGRLGQIPASAHQVALTCVSFTFAAVIGIGAATSVRVGRAVGRADRPGTRRAGVTGLVFGAGLMTITALIFLILPAHVARLFTNEDAVVAAAVPLMRIAALFQLSDGAQAIAAGALRGAGDTRSPLWGNLAGHYAVGFPVMLLLAFTAGLGAPGLWWGLSAGLTATALVLIARFLWLSARPIARA